MLDIRQIRYFLAVAEDLHFTRAADRLHVAQSALSTQIKKLEEQLGVRLLARKKRATVELTDAGALFLVEAQRALQQVQRAESVGHRAGRGELGHVEIGYVASAAFSGLLPKAILEFTRQRPNVTLRLAEMETPRQLEAVADGQLDIAFVRPRPHYPVGVKAVILRHERLLLAVPADHRLAGSAALDSLASEVFIVPQFDEPAGFTEYVADFVSTIKPAPENTHRVRDFLTAITLVAGGFGVALVPESIRCLSMANVVYRAIDSYDRAVGLAVAHRKDESAPAVASFISICTSPHR